MTARATRLLAAALCCVAFARAQQPEQPPQDPTERVEHWPDGAVKRRFRVDQAGREHGKLEAFAADGTRTLLCGYSHGLRDGACEEWREDGTRLRSCRYVRNVLHGPFEEFAPDGSTLAQGTFRDGLRHGTWTELRDDGRRRTAEYRAGELHGTLKITQGGKTLTKQVWKSGRLEKLDDLQPFPRAADALRAELAAILAPAPTPPAAEAGDAADPLAAQRQAALRRLQAYRHLCGLPWQDMVLVPEWNLRCDAAAEACRRLGHLDHHPPDPGGMDPQRYALAVEGAGHSNLAISGSLPGSVDGYMDDSDPGNIDRIGHRRWCLNPAMKKTGFGSDENFHAMWSMDASGGGAKGLDAVYYPPRGAVPVDLFAARRAFSISLLRGGMPKADALAATVRELDEDFLCKGEPLQLDHLAVAAGGYGSGPTIVFRPVGIVVEPGRRYLVEVSTDAGKSFAYRYVVAFVEAVGG